MNALLKILKKLESFFFDATDGDQHECAVESGEEDAALDRSYHHFPLPPHYVVIEE